MKLNFLKSLVMCITVTGFLLSGCATNQPQSSRRYVWPRPPDEPKIEWIKSYYGQNDFPKSGFSVFLETLFGGEEGHIFEKPIDVKSNGKGVVYVTDVAIPGIFRFDLLNQKVDLWERGSDPDTTLALVPYFIALDDKDNVYAVGSGSTNIYVVDSNGTFLRKIDFKGKVKSAGGILVDSEKKRIFLVDNVESKVAIFDLDGKYISSFGKKGEDKGEFNRPSPIVMNRLGEIIIGDVMNGRIQIFDREGKFLRMFGQRGDGSADFQVMKGVAVDTDNNVYVTDGKANQIKIFSKTGDYLMSFGTAYSVTKTMKESPGGFLLPQGIFIDGSDTIYVADQANMRFQVFKYLKGEVKKDAGQLKGGK